MGAVMTPLAVLVLITTVGRQRQTPKRTQVENESAPLGRNLLIETVRCSGGSRLIDDTQDVQTRNCIGTLRGLTLRVVKVSGDCDNRICNSATKVRLGGFE